MRGRLKLQSMLNSVFIYTNIIAKKFTFVKNISSEFRKVTRYVIKI